VPIGKNKLETIEKVIPKNKIQKDSNVFLLNCMHATTTNDIYISKEIITAGSVNVFQGI
jgi:hypothetical protein